MDYRPIECIKMVDMDLATVGLPTYTELRDALLALVLEAEMPSPGVEAADALLHRSVWWLHSKTPPERPVVLVTRDDLRQVVERHPAVLRDPCTLFRKVEGGMTLADLLHWQNGG